MSRIPTHTVEEGTTTGDTKIDALTSVVREAAANYAQTDADI